MSQSWVKQWLKKLCCASQVVDSSPSTRAAVQEASVRKGTDVRVAETATSATGSILRSPDIDVVVINEILEDAEPESLIGILKTNSATENVKIIIAARDVEAATARFDGKVDAVIQGPIAADTLAAAIRDAGVEIPALRARADKVAIAAGQALVALGRRDVDLSGALGSLEAQLGRNDEVAIPAAHALGQSGSGEQLSALVSIATGGSSDALRVASARAAGMIMAALARPCPKQ